MERNGKKEKSTKCLSLCKNDSKINFFSTFFSPKKGIAFHLDNKQRENAAYHSKRSRHQEAII